MKDQELHQLLQELHAEIENTRHVDEDDQALLRDLGNHIDKLLARQNDSQVKPATLRQIEETIDTLEVNHPTLTSLLSKLLATLSNAGI
jgi:hypothetical protein